jgi:hypothetical protein
VQALQLGEHACISSHMFRNTNLIECLGDRVCYKFSA